MATPSAAAGAPGDARACPAGLIRGRPPAPSVSPACDIRLFASAAPASPAHAAQICYKLQRCPAQHGLGNAICI